MNHIYIYISYVVLVFSTLRNSVFHQNAISCCLIMIMLYWYFNTGPCGSILHYASTCSWAIINTHIKPFLIFNTKLPHFPPSPYFLFPISKKKPLSLFGLFLSVCQHGGNFTLCILQAVETPLRQGLHLCSLLPFWRPSQVFQCSQGFWC